MLDQYRLDFSEFNIACAREHYLFLSGQKNSLEIASIYDRYGHLFDREQLESLKEQLTQSASQPGNDDVSIRRLFTFAVEQYLENTVKSLTERIGDYEASATVECLDRKMTFQESSVAITTEGNRENRREIYKARLDVVEASNELRAERLQTLHQTARSLEYSSYVELFQQLRQLDYSSLADEAASLLSKTEPLYVTRLHEALTRGLAISLDQAERSDAMFLLHLTGFDDRFPEERMLQVYKETMSGLGIRTDAQSNIDIDSEPRPRKNPRAFCMPISIPEDIKLVIRPSGGQSDYQSFLHESGHAQQYGWASAQLPPEFKYTGDYALTETYAFLFNHLISDREWLAVFMGFKDSADFVRSVMLARLVTVRRYVAKLIFERQLHLDDDLPNLSELYAELQTDATNFQAQAGEFLFDLDDSFYSASYLRAWAFEVSLRDYLKTRFSSRWWASRRAGSFLKEIWETGDMYTADEMASQIGIGPIRFDPLIDEFNAALR